MDALQNTTYYINQRQEMRGFLPGSAQRILDVGCGEGLFGEYFVQQQKEVWGIEPHEPSAAAAAKRLTKCVHGGLPEALLQVPDAYFDVITFNDVLEHLTDPWAALKAVSVKLKSDGVVVTSIPNVRYIGNLMELLFQGDWRYREYGILDRTHFRFFTQKSMVRLFEESGYRVERVEGINKASTLKLRLMSALTLGRMNDTRYLQFAVVAKKSNV